jgi:hypothetical protein
MPKTPRYNRPGAPANPPQHLFDEGYGLEDGRPEALTEQNWHHQQTGPGTAPPGLDVADPHPSDEGDPYAAPNPGGDAMPPSDTQVPHKNIGPNPERNSGHAPAGPQHPADKTGRP